LKLRPVSFISQMIPGCTNVGVTPKRQGARQAALAAGKWGDSRARLPGMHMLLWLIPLESANDYHKRGYGLKKNWQMSKDSEKAFEPL
jgi:hypothetical protein